MAVHTTGDIQILEFESLGSLPPVAPAGKTRVIRSPTSGTLLISVDGSAYAPLSGRGVLAWGNNSIAAGTARRFMDPFGDRATAPTFERFLVVPRAGLLRNLFVRHRTPGGNANVITYIVRVNGVDTALAASIAANSGALQTSNVVDSVLVAQGDRVSFAVDKAAAIGSSPGQINGTLEYAA